VVYGARFVARLLVRPFLPACLPPPATPHLLPSTCHHLACHPPIPACCLCLFYRTTQAYRVSLRDVMMTLYEITCRFAIDAHRHAPLAGFSVANNNIPVDASLFGALNNFLNMSFRCLRASRDNARILLRTTLRRCARPWRRGIRYNAVRLINITAC